MPLIVLDTLSPKQVAIFTLPRRGKRRRWSGPFPEVVRSDHSGVVAAIRHWLDQVNDLDELQAVVDAAFARMDVISPLDPAEAPSLTLPPLTRQDLEDLR
jgi:hypothetical protein